MCLLLVPDKILDLGQHGFPDDYFHISQPGARSWRLLSRFLGRAQAAGRAGCWPLQQSPPANSFFSFLKGGSFSRCHNRQVGWRSHRHSLVWKIAEGLNKSVLCEGKMMSIASDLLLLWGSLWLMSYFRFSCFVFGWVSFSWFFLGHACQKPFGLLDNPFLPRGLCWFLPLLIFKFSKETVEDICLHFPSEFPSGTSPPPPGRGAVHHITPCWGWAYDSGRPTEIPSSLISRVKPVTKPGMLRFVFGGADLDTRTDVAPLLLRMQVLRLCIISQHVKAAWFLPMPTEGKQCWDTKDKKTSRL